MVEKAYLFPMDFELGVLCSEAEMFFLDSLRIPGGAVIVNNIFLVKSVGKLCALCLEDVYDERGILTYKKGGMYAPFGETRKIIQKNFGFSTNDETYSTELITEKRNLDISNAQWIFWRNQGYYDNFMSKVRTALEEGIFLEEIKQTIMIYHESMPRYFYPES